MASPPDVALPTFWCRSGGVSPAPCWPAPMGPVPRGPQDHLAQEEPGETKVPRTVAVSLLSEGIQASASAWIRRRLAATLGPGRGRSGLRRGLSLDSEVPGGASADAMEGPRAAVRSRAGGGVWTWFLAFSKKQPGVLSPGFGQAVSTSNSCYQTPGGHPRFAAN